MVKKIKRLIGMVSGCFSGFLGTDIGVDLGTSSTVISVRNKGIVINEPSVVAICKKTNVVLDNGQAVGKVAHEMLGKTPASITAIRPMENGVISNFQATEVMLSYFIKKAQSMTKSGLAKPRVVIAVPSGITQVERRAVIESGERAGARKVYLVDEPMAAGIGSGLAVGNPTGTMIVDIGGGTTEVAIMSLSDIASCESVRIGGDTMDKAIVNHVKKTYNLLIGEVSAERVKIEIGSASALETELTMEVAGRDTVTGMPGKITLTSQEVRQALKEPISEIIESVIRTLEKAKPELAADLIDNGIHICGGGSLLRHMDTVIENATGLRTERVDDPMQSVAKGTETYISNIDMWKESMDMVDD